MSKLKGKLTKALLAAFVLSNINVAAATEPQAETFKDCEGCPEMVVIPAGQVSIGSYPNEAFRRKGERPKQLAKIAAPFAMAKTEITLAQYREFMQASRHKPKDMVYQGKTYQGCNYFDGKGYGYVTAHNWADSGYPQHEESPVVCVSWSDATAYAKWLSNKTKRNYRVPSTVEFEYALRAGSDSPWPWGNDPSKACEYANVADQTFAIKYPKRAQFACDDQYLFSARVAKFKANAFDLHDMLGNVWEWTNDCWHDELSNAPVDGTSWQTSDGGDCTARTPKGGSWISGPAWSRAAARSKDAEHYRSYMLGFRLAADYSQEDK